MENGEKPGKKRGVIGIITTWWCRVAFCRTEFSRRDAEALEGGRAHAKAQRRKGVKALAQICFATWRLCVITFSLRVSASLRELSRRRKV